MEDYYLVIVPVLEIHSLYEINLALFVLFRCATCLQWLKTCSQRPEESLLEDSSMVRP